MPLYDCVLQQRLCPGCILQGGRRGLDCVPTDCDPAADTPDVFLQIGGLCLSHLPLL